MIKIIIVCSLLLSINIIAQENKTSNSMDELNWLSGYWSSNENEILMEEYWLPISNNTMFGIHRDSFQSGKVFFEYLSIYQKNDSIVYEARPMGKNPTMFYLQSFAENQVVFENMMHDYPQRIMYTNLEDTLIARIEGTVK